MYKKVLEYSLIGYSTVQKSLASSVIDGAPAILKSL